MVRDKHVAKIYIFKSEIMSSYFIPICTVMN